VDGVLADSPFLRLAVSRAHMAEELDASSVDTIDDSPKVSHVESDIVGLQTIVESPSFQGNKGVFG